MSFYIGYAWKKLRREVLKDDRHECQYCKKQGKYTRATEVHHIRRVDKYPELALSKTYIDEHGKEQRQLISLCKACHMKEHEYQAPPPLTVERW